MLGRSPWADYASTPKEGGGSGTPGGDTQQQRDAFELLQATLREWDLASLIPDLENILTEGVSGDVAMLRLRNTDAYKRRFKGNLERQKRGLPAMSEAEYLETETALKTVVRRYGGEGTAIGGLNSDEQLANWIGNDVSPTELNQRFSMYRDNYLAQPTWVRDAWAQHGLTPWQAMMAAADPSVSETDLANTLNTFAVGSEALQQYGQENFDFGADRFEEYARRGVTADDARKAFSDVAQREEREGFLAGLAGEQLSRQDQEKAALFGDAGTEKRRRKILEQELGRFSQNPFGGENALRGTSQGAY